MKVKRYKRARKDISCSMNIRVYTNLPQTLLSRHDANNKVTEIHEVSAYQY